MPTAASARADKEFGGKYKSRRNQFIGTTTYVGGNLNIFGDNKPDTVGAEGSREVYPRSSSSRRNNSQDVHRDGGVTADPALHAKILRSLRLYQYPRRVTQYVDRSDISKQVDEAAHANVYELHKDTTVVILSGMGGQGKTQLAIDFCERAERKGIYQIILWFDASHRSAFIQSFDTLSEILNSSAERVDDLATRVRFVVDNIGQNVLNWLLIFDNYDNPRDFGDIRNYIPKSYWRKGTVLITTRSQDLADLGTVVHVGGLSEREAISLLMSDTSKGEVEHSRDEAQAITVAGKLGFLALAIDQARAYIRGPPARSFGQFLEHFEHRKEIVLRTVPGYWEYRRKDPHGQEHVLCVFTTWELSFQLIDDSTYGGRETKGHLLEMLACLNYSQISMELFDMHRRRLTWREWLRERMMLYLADFGLSEALSVFRLHGSWDLASIEATITELVRLSLVRDQGRVSDTNAQRFSLHPLVREWLLLRTVEKARLEAFNAAAFCVLECAAAHLEIIDDMLPEYSNDSDAELLQHLSSLYTEVTKLKTTSVTSRWLDTRSRCIELSRTRMHQIIAEKGRRQLIRLSDIKRWGPEKYYDAVTEQEMDIQASDRADLPIHNMDANLTIISDHELVKIPPDSVPRPLPSTYTQVSSTIQPPRFATLFENPLDPRIRFGTV